MMKIIFMGTPDFSVPVLDSLVEAGHEVVAVITQPDKPKGRGKEMQPTPVKEAALRYNIPVYQPVKVRDDEFVKVLEGFNVDVMVVVAFGQILTKNILDMPKYGCINVHASLLPKYRGAAPMQRAIIDGKQTTGITTMYMDVGLDTGNMILKDEVAIEENDNFEDIHDRLGKCGADLLVKTIEQIADGTAPSIPQDDSLSTYAAKIEKSDCLINFDTDARSVHNLIRGLSPIPLAFTHTPDGRLLKVLESRCEADAD